MSVKWLPAGLLRQSVARNGSGLKMVKTASEDARKRGGVVVLLQVRSRVKTVAVWDRWTDERGG